MLTKKHKDTIQELKKEFDQYKQGKEPLLDLLFEAELPESVYNSNAIENSTLTIAETERILMELEVARDVSVREVFEAKNLARVFEYIRNSKDRQRIDADHILFLHKMLMTAIDDTIAGRFRGPGEYVRVGSHIGAAPEHLGSKLEAAIKEFHENTHNYIIERIVLFHLEFENIHPFVDGNGRIGRVLANMQLMQVGFPPLIVRDREKESYYKAFQSYSKNGSTKEMELVFVLALMESFHKRLAYLGGEDIAPLTDYAEMKQVSKNSLLNKARRQTIPAFREKGIWKMGVSK